MLEFRVVQIQIPFITGQEFTGSRDAVFTGVVRDAQIALSGFDVSFRNGDHHLGQFKVDCLDPVISGNVVTGSVAVLLRDFSGNIDDPYVGIVELLVIADVM